uniref:DNA 3'-5' helicase n=1 Tax=Rhizochromulina marina TaxID=1034831 RepID=A0A7S2WL44_9STRA|mmetsp:Transcript_27408/g.79975  ORF Transcript_27408/g.79975 Transcript_27408/m.79975 type:complete len:950 (+) Transcript_27408:34-2883(+)
MAGLYEDDEEYWQEALELTQQAEEASQHQESPGATRGASAREVVLSPAVLSPPVALLNGARGVASSLAGLPLAADASTEGAGDGQEYWQEALELTQQAEEASLQQESPRATRAAVPSPQVGLVNGARGVASSPAVPHAVESEVATQAAHRSRSPEEPAWPEWLSSLSMDNEWAAIVGRDLAPGQSLRVRAAAGAGKTTVLMHFMALRPQEKFVFLTYNKSVSESKRKLFRERGLRNVEVYSFHSLAHRNTLDIHPAARRGQHYFKEITKPQQLELVADKISWFDAKHVGLMLNKFYATTEPQVLPTMAPEQRRQLPRKKADDKRDARCAHIANQLFQHIRYPKPHNSVVDVSHDAYLKVFALEAHRQQQAFAPYTCILLDEAQDCNEAMIEIIVSQLSRKKSVIFAYDENQCIYQFRNAAGTILEKLESTYTLPLTKSFRFGKPLDDLAWNLVKHFRGESYSFGIRGAGGPVLIDKAGAPNFAVEEARKARKLRGNGPGQPLAVIGRLNLSLILEFKKIADLALDDLRVYFVGGTQNAFGGMEYLRNLWNLKRENLGAITMPFLKNWKGGYPALKEWVEKSGEADLDLIIRLRVIETVKDIGFIDKCVRKMAVNDESAADLVFTTVHKAKGLEWDRVYVLGDLLGQGDSSPPPYEYLAGHRTGFPPRGITLDGTSFGIDLRVDNLFREPFEEVNIAYTAITRARRVLWIHPASWLWLFPVRIDSYSIQSKKALGVVDTKAPTAASAPPASLAPASSSVEVLSQEGLVEAVVTKSLEEILEEKRQAAIAAGEMVEILDDSSEDHAAPGDLADPMPPPPKPDGMHDTSRPASPAVAHVAASSSAADVGCQNGSATVESCPLAEDMTAEDAAVSAAAAETPVRRSSRKRAAPSPPYWSPVSTEVVEKMRVSELRTMLNQRGLRSSGRKQELIRRLSEFRGGGGGSGDEDEEG